jgi:hypothetical protein
VAADQEEGPAAAAESRVEAEDTTESSKTLILSLILFFVVFFSFVSNFSIIHCHGLTIVLLSLFNLYSAYQ